MDAHAPRINRWLILHVTVGPWAGRMRQNTWAWRGPGWHWERGPTPRA